MVQFCKKYWLTIFLGVFLFVLPWQTRFIFGSVPLEGAVSEYGTLSLYASEVILVIGLFIGYAADGFPKLKKENARPAFLALAILLYSLLVVPFSAAPVVSLMALFHFAVALLFFLALLDERTDFKRLLMVFAASLVLPVLLGIFQVLSGGSPAISIFGLALRNAEHLGDAVVMMGDERVLRAYGTFPHPNMFGGYLAVGILAAIGASEKKYAPYFFVLSAFLTLGLLLTASRSAFLGLVLGSVLAGIVLKVRRISVSKKIVLPAAVVIIAIVLLSSLFAPGLVSKVRGGGELELRSLNERMTQYEDFPNVVGGSWLFGNGPGTYVFALAHENPERPVWEYQPLHNVPLLIVGEIGIVGFILVLLWSSTIDKMNLDRFPNRDAVLAFAMGNVILAILFFDHYLWSSYAGLCLIALVMGLTVRMGEEQK